MNKTPQSSIKMYIMPVVFLITLFSLAIATQGAKVVFDDFEAPSINLTKWNPTGADDVSAFSRVGSSGSQSLLFDSGLPMVNATSVWTGLETTHFVLEWYWYSNGTSDNSMQTAIGSANINKGFSVSGFWSFDNVSGFFDTGVSTTTGKGDVSSDWMRNRFEIQLGTPSNISWYIGNETTPTITGHATPTMERLRFTNADPPYYIDDIVVWDLNCGICAEKHDINGDLIIPDISIQVFLNGTPQNITIPENETFMVYHLGNASTEFTRNGTTVTNASFELLPAGYYNYSAVQPENPTSRGSAFADVLPIVQSTTTLLINGSTADVNDIDGGTYQISMLNTEGQFGDQIFQDGVPIANNTIVTLGLGTVVFTGQTSGGSLVLGSSDSSTITITAFVSETTAFENAMNTAGTIAITLFITLVVMVFLVGEVIRRFRK